MKLFLLQKVTYIARGLRELATIAHVRVGAGAGVALVVTHARAAVQARVLHRTVIHVNHRLTSVSCVELNKLEN